MHMVGEAGWRGSDSTTPTESLASADPERTATRRASETAGLLMTRQGDVC